MKTVIIDGYTTNPGDLSWDGLLKFGEYDVYDRTDNSQNDNLIFERIKDAEAIIVNKNKISAELMKKCTKLKYIGESATGYDNIDISGAKELGIGVTNVPKYSTDAVAQHTLALILHLSNHVAIHNQAVKSGEWSNALDFCFTKDTLTLLTGKSIGIIGYGAIGKKVAKICEALGMIINIYSKDPKIALTSDYISLHCPLNDDTRGFVNEELIGKMKDGVVIINTARGGLIDEFAMSKALKTKKVAAFAADVLCNEPPEKDNPLIGLDNVVLTPHIAWVPKETREYLINVIVKNLESFINGERLNRVDIVSGDLLDF